MLEQKGEEALAYRLFLFFKKKKQNEFCFFKKKMQMCMLEQITV